MVCVAHMVGVRPDGDERIDGRGDDADDADPADTLEAAETTRSKRRCKKNGVDRGRRRGEGRLTGASARSVRWQHVPSEVAEPVLSTAGLETDADQWNRCGVQTEPSSEDGSLRVQSI